jgi:hypothetical protein
MKIWKELVLAFPELVENVREYNLYFALLNFFIWIQFIWKCTEQVLYSGNASDFHLGDARIESRPGYQLF